MFFFFFFLIVTEIGNLNCTRRKKRNRMKHEKHDDWNTNMDFNKNSNTSPNDSDHEAETLPTPPKKRVKITNESVNTTIIPKPMSVWICQNRQLDQREKIDLGFWPYLNVLIERICRTFKESNDDTNLTILCDDGTWAKICTDDINIALTDIGIKHNSIISIQQEEMVIVTLILNDIINEISSNLLKKTYLLIKHIPSNRDIQIEFDENDTISVLKKKISSQFQFDFDTKDLRLTIDSKLIDISYNNRTLSSLNISSTSTITINEKEKTKQIIKGNGHYGLRNLGNTCYMNSALQCLSNVELLTDYFLTHENVQGNVSKAYYDFIQNIWKHNRSYNPKSIKTNISRYAPQFDNYDQQDAHEFMVFLLNQMHNDLKQETETISIISKLFSCQIEGITTCLTCEGVRKTSNLINFIPLSIDNDKKRRVFKIIFQSIYLSIEINATSCIEDLVVAFINELEQKENYPIEGLIERLQVISTRTNKEFLFDTLVNNVLDTELKFIVHEEILRKIKIEINHEDNPLELFDCLHEFIAVETPINLWFCKMECNKRVHIAKQMLLSILPPVLIIQLKRFTEKNGYMQKLHTLVNFPIDGLDLSQFLVNQEENALYDLTAVVNHMGNINSGHYTTYARQLTDTSKQWFCFNDTQVTMIDNSYVVSSSAYMLIYVRRMQLETFC